MPGTQAIDGITSGFDTTAIVDALISFERRPAVQMEQDQANKTNMVTALKALQAKLVAVETQAGTLRRASTFEKASISVSDEQYLTATRGGEVTSGSYDLRVLAVARNHQIASQGISDVDEALMGTGTITIAVGNSAAETITIDENNNSLVGIKNAINSAGAGVTASIINDGSSSNPYRLVLAANETGAKKQISFTASLSGGNSLDFDNASFDAVEEASIADATTAAMSLGSTAGYSGSTNKSYIITVDGSGSYTVGADTITLNWTDGTNSGSIEIDAEDTEVEFTGAGADGLYLQLGAGVVHGGDEFRVDAFAPTLQDPTDARLQLGSSSGGGSPIVVTSASNNFGDVIGGINVTARKVTPDDEVVTVSSEIDTASIKSSIKSFINAYNDAMDYINEHSKYNQETGESGVLFGDSTLWTTQNRLRSIVTSTVTGVSSRYNQLYGIGIRHDENSKLAIADSGALDKALADDFQAVVNIFTDSGTSSSQFIEFISMTGDSKAGATYDVDVTSAATNGNYAAAAIGDPAVSPLTLNSTNNQLRLKIDGLTSEPLLLTEKTYNSGKELATEIQRQLDADGRVGHLGAQVSWDSGSSQLIITSGSYGSSSKIEMDTTVDNSAHTILGLAAGTSTEGTDVAGTINGEAATGRGQYLTGDEGNENTAGVKLLVTLGQSQVTGGVEGSITISRGVASQAFAYLDKLTAPTDGVFDTKIRGINSQIESIKGRISDIDERLAMRRESLMQQFWDMENALAEMNSQMDYLTSMATQLSKNWQLSGKRK